MANWLRMSSYAALMAAIWAPQLGLKLTFGKFETMVGLLLVALVLAVWEVAQRLKDGGNND